MEMLKMDNQIMIMLWNVGLTILMAVIGFVAKEKSEEINRLNILLNRTREEIAREHITRAEVERDLEKIMERFDAGIARLELKIDSLRKEHRA